MEKIDLHKVKYKDLKFLYPYFKKYRKYIIKGSIGLAITTLLIIPSPFITKYIIDVVFPAKDAEKLIILSLLIVIILIIKSFSKYYQSLNFIKFSENTILKIRNDLFSKIQKLSFNFLKINTTGYLISRINDDVNSLRGVMAETFVILIRDGFTFLFGMIAMFYISWELALASLILLPFLAISTFYFNIALRNFSNKYFESRAQIVRKLEESINGIFIIRDFFAEKFDHLKFFSLQKTNVYDSVRLSITGTLSNVINSFIIGLGPVLVILGGGYLIFDNQLTLGGLIAFNSFLGYLFGPLSRTININNTIQNALISINRINQILDLESKEIVKLNSTVITKIDKIEFENVSFKYSDSKNIFRDISFKIELGDKIGIIGESGEGKTTLANLILANMKPLTGKIIINNGYDLQDIKLSNYKRSIRYVEQEPYLFYDTIQNNISMGNTRYNQNQIALAAELANIHSFIMEQSKGYQTILGGDGIHLSTGQKQRIALARAILINPDVLIFDEPTSNLDLQSEKFIKETLKNLADDKILIVITHRINLLDVLDKVFFVSDNKVKILDGNYLINNRKNNPISSLFINAV